MTEEVKAVVEEVKPNEGTPILGEGVTSQEAVNTAPEYTEVEKKAGKIAIKLGVLILCLMMLQGCRTWDRAYIWGYELVHGSPDKPMQQEVK